MSEMAEVFAVPRDETAERFADPRVGDWFTEMCAFWMYVEVVNPEYVIVRERDGDRLGAPRLFPTHDAFRAAYAYGTIPGYWVSYSHNRPIVSPSSKEREPHVAHP